MGRDRGVVSGYISLTSRQWVGRGLDWGERRGVWPLSCPVMVIIFSC